MASLAPTHICYLWFSLVRPSALASAEATRGFHWSLCLQSPNKYTTVTQLTEYIGLGARL